MVNCKQVYAFTYSAVLQAVDLFLLLCLIKQKVCYVLSLVYECRLMISY